VAGLVVDFDDAVRDVRGQPGSVCGWDQDIRLAVRDEDGYGDVSNAEAPRSKECKVVIHPASHTVERLEAPQYASPTPFAVAAEFPASGGALGMAERRLLFSVANSSVRVAERDHLGVSSFAGRHVRRRRARRLATL
jgi:hypothetical protein